MRKQTTTIYIADDNSQHNTPEEAAMHDKAHALASATGLTKGYALCVIKHWEAVKAIVEPPAVAAEDDDWGGANVAPRPSKIPASANDCPVCGAREGQYHKAGCTYRG